MRASLIIALSALGAAACTGESPGNGQLDVSSAAEVATPSDADDIDADDVAEDDALDCTCDGLECGANPCGEVCGTCPAVAPFCHDHVCFIDCQPSCGDAVCGDDGCGGSCGVCDGSAECVDGACVCEPDCDGAVCGDDGCGGSCGSCGELEGCRDGACAPCSCDGLECGDSGCGLDCGACPAAAPFCVDNLCAITCTADCGDAVCGDDGCGGDCGDCPGGSCDAGACVGCPCDGAVCGDNACGESCGECLDEATPYCSNGQCVVEPPPCPMAVITLAQGPTVAPNTMLHLSGADSTAASGEVTGWEWSVVAPVGSASVFLPSPYVENPSFEAAVAGTYTFHLKVYVLGTPSCEDASHSVTAAPTEGVFVELVWTTPGDPDETDTGFIGSRSAGSDLDLHFIHPLAVGETNPEGWFHSRYDTYWANSKPNWGGPGPEDDPSLDRDDTDGAGPENISLTLPENGKTYTVGVHYYDDWNYGHSIARVRVYVGGQLALEWGGVTLENVSSAVGDMWECCTITWPGGAVSKIEEGAPGSNVPVIRPNYSEPFPFPF